MNVVSIGGYVRNILPYPVPAQLLCTLWPHRLFSSRKLGHPTQPKALKIIDIISPKISTAASDSRSHLRLIQDFLQTTSNQDLISDFASSTSVLGFSNTLDQILESSFLNDQKSSTLCLRFNASSLSNGVSLCASMRDLRGGIQYHCLSISTGFLANAYVGSSLITLYGKCGELANAYKMFCEMPVKNVVTWTALISGFAQECQVDICLELLSVMRNSTLKPNDFTFTSLLSACTGSGALGQGRSAHCQIIQMGFHSYLHIANALISMYSKCGSVQDAFYIFESMIRKDIVSWNSMISGYAQHGLALQAIELFEKMEELGVKPDSITFLGVLSSCRHAGLVKGGRNYFNSMVEYSVKPELDHYSCLVDLLGRAGLVEEALQVILRMPLSPNAIVWGSLLTSCRLHGSVWIGIQAAERRLLLEPDCAATHVQLANLYASVRCWDKAARVRKLMKDGALKTSPGLSWIEIKNKVYRFRAEDRSNTIIREILVVLDYLVDHMITLEYKCEMHEEEINIFEGS